MKSFPIGILSLAAISILANMNPQTGFAPFANKYFVETGTFGGSGIQMALACGHYEAIWSIELDDRQYTNARARFARHEHVHIVKGDSGVVLFDVIEHINEPITFWLDAHNGFPNPNKPDEKNTPLMEELDQIKLHPIKEHTIIIDDMHCCKTKLFDNLSREDIENKVREINPDYNIFYIAGGDQGEYSEGIMVASIKYTCLEDCWQAVNEK